MQTVTDFNEDDTDIITHRQQQLLKILSLCRCLFAKDASTDFGQTINNLCYLRTKDIFNILYGIVGIFYDVMEQSRTDTGRT